MNGAADTPTARLVISCPDGPGIVAAVSEFLFRHGANILSSDQHSTDPEGGAFFMRMVFSLARLDVGLEHLEAAFDAEVGERFEMDWRLAPATERKRTAIMVSREDHCLLDLLWRWRAREIEMDVGLVVSNHPDLRETVAGFGVPFELVPVTAATKAAAEARQLELLAGRFDLVVLARYMQILSKSFLEGLGAPAINIHHSFLPAFAGASPYEQAKERGVKMIGATAHYVTPDLDEGPIIEQQVERVTHSMSAVELVSAGRDVECQALARAVCDHVERRVFLNGQRTVVFR